MLDRHLETHSADGRNLVVLGGLPGAGKTTVALRLSREFSIPRLASDVIGGAVRDTSGIQLASGDAFRAGYNVLFTLAEEFLEQQCPVIIDTNMGWDFQWQSLDNIRQRITGLRIVLIILRCPRKVCVERISQRHVDNSGSELPPNQILKHQRVWDYLDALDRPDADFVDADRDPESVYSAVRQIIIQRFAH
jgi:predicted kinase